MWHQFIADTSFLLILVALDDRIAEEARALGCRHCSGPLHGGDYPRKPRGLPREAEAAYATRRSLCCGHCRKRTTPPSVRFLGRKVYVGWLLFVATVCWLAGFPFAIEVPTLTLRRWVVWWQSVFVSTSFWRELRCRFAAAPCDVDLPLALLERFPGAPALQLRGALAFVAPVTTESAPWMRVDFRRAEDVDSQ